MADTTRIAALYFGKDGLGPDHTSLEVFPVRGDAVVPPALALRVRASGLVFRAQVDGGFYMQRKQVEELHKALGEWLADPPTTDGKERA